MAASDMGHSETLALLLANKADVHAANQVIITWLFEYHFSFEIVWIYLCYESFIRWSHWNTRAASGQQSWRACGWSSNNHNLIFWILFTFEIGWKLAVLCSRGFYRGSHRDTRAAFGQQSWRACGWSRNNHNLIVWILFYSWNRMDGLVQCMLHPVVIPRHSRCFWPTKLTCTRLIK